MADSEEDIIASGAQIIWVLEQSGNHDPGTAENCRFFMDARGSDKGICVGDSQTKPEAGVWDKSPLAIGRGFDVIMRRSEMRILSVTTHGTPSGNDNTDGEALLEEVKAVLQ